MRANGSDKVLQDIWRTYILLVVSFFSLLFAQWESDVRLTYEPHTSRTCYNNAKCIAAGGNPSEHDLHIVWHDYRSSYPEIFYKCSPNQGNNWEPDTLISAPGGADGRQYPCLRISYPYVHVVYKYIGVDNGEGIKYTHTPDSGHTWVQEITLDYYPPYPIPDLGTPSIAVSDNYVHLVYDVFLSSSGWTNGMIYYIRSTDNGIDWGSNVQLYITGNSPFPVYPSIDVSGLYVHVVWQQGEGIYYMRSSDNGSTWGSIAKLDDTSDDSKRPSISVFGNQVHLVWHDDRDGNWEIYHKYSTDNGNNWSPDVRLTNDQYAQEYPNAYVGDNLVHVVWMDNRDGNTEIYYERSIDQGVNWEPEVRLTNSADSSCNASVIACGDSVHVAWCDHRDGNWEIYYKRDPTGNQAILDGTDRRMPIQECELTPNPFTYYTTISGYEEEYFVLYDIAGRKVGRYQGSCVGLSLAPGVYFVIPENKLNIVLRVVKVR
jgi:hypothetical protein